VKEIAARVGANDISHFLRQYKAVYGQTPSETRAQFTKAIICDQSSENCIERK